MKLNLNKLYISICFNLITSDWFNYIFELWSDNTLIYIIPNKPDYVTIIYCYLTFLKINKYNIYMNQIHFHFYYITRI